MPWITPVEAPVVQGLMRIVAIVSTEVVTLLGIPAQLEGSLIRIQNGLVGVNEACSGVRSLQTSLMIGLLFGELKRFTVGRRLGLIVGAVVIAMIFNFLRAIILVWLSATRGAEVANSWHDALGYAIVGGVFLGTMALAAAFGRSKTPIENRESKIENPSPFTALTATPAVAALLWLVAVEFGAAAWYRASETDLVARESWTVQQPTDAPGFRPIEIDDQVRQTLRYDSRLAGRLDRSDPHR